MFKKKRGQSILEYVIILIAIVGVVAWAAKAIIAEAVKKGLTDATTAVGTAADKLPK